MTNKGRQLLAVAVGAAVAAAGAKAVHKLVSQRADATPASARRWYRTNFAGDSVGLAEGPALAAGLVAGQLARGAVAGDSRSLALATHTAIAGGLGLLDDLAEANPAAAKGLRGHLTALRSGTVTTGAAKLVGIAVSSFATAAIVERGTHGGAAQRATAIVVDTALLAGMTNLINLFDLRPGRALKFALLVALPLGPQALPIAGAASVVAPRDLQGSEMAGDCGANALGSAIGGSWIVSMPVSVRAIAAGSIIALTLASERVSFSRVIADTPMLDRLDRAGTPRAEPVAPK